MVVDHEKSRQEPEFKYPDFKEISVLVVDENSTNRLILHKTLSSWGLLVEQAASGAAALTLLQDNGTRFQLILLDQQMPDMDGFAVARAVRTNLKMTDIKIILLSSLGGLNSAIESELNISSSVTKPVKQSQLFNLLLQTLQTPKPNITIVSEQPNKPQNVPKAKSARILLVEDNKDNQKLAGTILEKAGYGVDIAANGLIAFEKTREYFYDLILMDIQMPEMDGFAATREIRAYEQESHGERVPILALTAHALPEYREKCLQQGMDDFFTKPIKKKKLLAAVELWLDPRPVILVVDDSYDNRKLVEKFLNSMALFKLIFAKMGSKPSIK